MTAPREAVQAVIDEMRKRAAVVDGHQPPPVGFARVLDWADRLAALSAARRAERAGDRTMSGRSAAPIEQDFVKRLVDQLLAVAKDLGPGSTMGSACLVRAEYYVDLVKAWQDRPAPGAERRDP